MRSTTGSWEADVGAKALMIRLGAAADSTSGFIRVLLLCAVVTAGCGPHQIPSTAAQEVGDLKPAVEDVDAGTMRMRPGFSPGTYTVIIVTPFKVSTTGVSDDGQSRLAQDMIRPLQSQLLKRLQLAGIFATDVD